ncbi:MAG: nucleotide exchange factor GrpE [Actinomycetota bacterium]|nr:nucleotide exchange factor GrpE [Actinomycetota bacterium]
MTDKKPPEEQIEEEPAAVETEGKQLQEDLDKARAEAADYLDNLQRLKAEFDNFRKRMLREQSEFLSLATQEIIKELLPVVDNFGRALAHEIEDGHLDDYKGGMQLVYNQLVDALAKEGLTSEEPVGEPFDPAKHEAMMRVDSDEHPEGTVVAVLEKGYLLKGRVIRPAKVMVAG